MTEELEWETWDPKKESSDFIEKLQQEEKARGNPGPALQTITIEDVRRVRFLYGDHAADDLVKAHQETIKKNIKEGRRLNLNIENRIERMRKKHEQIH